MKIELSLEQRAAVYRALGEPHRLAIVETLLLSDRTPSELAAATGLESNHVAFHLGVLEQAGVVARGPGHGDGRRRYVRLRHAALPTLASTTRVEADRPLFVCTRNSARSQLAAALWARRSGRPAQSAGHRPAERVHPLAVAVAAAHGLDLSAASPRGYDAVPDEPDLVVSVCDHAVEVGLPFAAPCLHWSVPDPVDGVRAGFEAAYAELEERIGWLVDHVDRAA